MTSSRTPLEPLHNARSNAAAPAAPSSSLAAKPAQTRRKAEDWCYPTDAQMIEERRATWRGEPSVSYDRVEAVLRQSGIVSMAQLQWYWAAQNPTEVMTVAHRLDPGSKKDAPTAIPARVYSTPQDPTQPINGQSPLGTGLLTQPAFKNGFEAPVLTTQWTWADAAAAIAKLSNGIKAHPKFPVETDQLNSIHSAPKVLIAMQSSHPHFMLAHLACSHAGAVPVPIIIPALTDSAAGIAASGVNGADGGHGDDKEAVNSTGAEHAPALALMFGIIADINPILVITSDQTRAALQALIPKPALAARWGGLTPADVVATDGPAPEMGIQNKHHDTWNLIGMEHAGLDNIDSLPPPRQAAPTEGALLQFTSGSTGLPKGVIITHGNQQANLVTSSAICKVYRTEDAAYDGTHATLVVWQPAYHDMGLQLRCQCLWAGTTWVDLDPALFMGRPLMWLRALSIYRAASTGTPNFGMLNLKKRAFDAYALATRGMTVPPLLDLLATAGVSLQDLRCICVGAEPTSVPALMWTHDTLSALDMGNQVITHAFGSAEAVVAFSHVPISFDDGEDEEPPSEPAPPALSAEESQEAWASQVVAVTTEALGRDQSNVVATGTSSVTYMLNSKAGLVGLAAVGVTTMDIAPSPEDSPEWMVAEPELPVTRSKAVVVSLAASSRRFRVMRKSPDIPLPASQEDTPPYKLLSMGRSAALQPDTMQVWQDSVVVVGVEADQAEPGTVGELWTMSTGAGSGYWTSSSDPERQAELVSANGKAFCGYLKTGQGPFLCTGDAAFVHDNHVFVCGRLKEMITFNGRNIWSTDIERAAKEAVQALSDGLATTRSSVMAAVQLAAPDQTNIHGRAPIVLFVELAHGLAGQTLGPEVQAKMDSTALVMRQAVFLECGGVFLDRIVWVKSIERTSSSKIRRVPMQRGYLSAAGVQAVYEWSALTKRELVSVVRPVDPQQFRRVADAVKAAVLDRRVMGTVMKGPLEDMFPFMDAGMESRTATTFVSVLNEMEEIEWAVTVKMLVQHPTIELLAEAICNAQQAQA